MLNKDYKINGFFNLYKPSGITSAYALVKIKKKLNGEKVGHMGTLDPMASGVLPVAIGKSTRLFDYLLDKDKEYNANFTFGYETDTLDAEGKIIKETNVIPTKEEILGVIASLVGKVDQIPPLFSAKNVDGKRSYALARQGIQVELPPKQVEITSIKLNGKIDENTYNFTINCKGGTYIRSICRDMAYKLNSLATMTKLTRTKSGAFTLENAVSFNDIESIDLQDYIISPDKILSNESIYLGEKDSVELSFGRQVIIDKPNGFYKVYDSENIFVGVGEILNNNLKIKAYIKD